MKKLALLLILSLTLIPAQGTDWTRLLQGALKAGTAMSITDEKLAEMVAEEVGWHIPIVRRVLTWLNLWHLLRRWFGKR